VLKSNSNTVVYQKLSNKNLLANNKYVLNACAKSFGDNCKLAIKDRDSRTVVQSIDFSNDCGGQCINCGPCNGAYTKFVFYYDGQAGYNSQNKGAKFWWFTPANVQQFAMINAAGQFEVTNFATTGGVLKLYAQYMRYNSMCTDTNILHTIPLDCSGDVKIGYTLANWANDWGVLDNHVTLISAESKATAASAPLRLCDQRVCDCKTCVPSCTKAKVHAILFRWFGSATANTISTNFINAAGTVVGGTPGSVSTNVAVKSTFVINNIPQSVAQLKISVTCGTVTTVYTVAIACGSIVSGSFVVTAPATQFFFVEQVSTNRPISITLKVNANAAYGSSVTAKLVSTPSFATPFDMTKAVMFTSASTVPFTFTFGDEDEGLGLWVFKAAGGTDDYHKIPIDCSVAPGTVLRDTGRNVNAPLTVVSINCGNRNLCDKRYPCTRPCNTRPRHGGKGLKGSTGEGHQSSGASKGKWNPWNQVPGEEDKKKKQIELDTFNHNGSKKGRKYKNSSGSKSSGNTGSKKGSWGSKPTHIGWDSIPVYDLPAVCCDGDWKCKSALIDFKVNPAHRYYLFALSRDCNCHFDDICISEQPDSPLNLTEWANGIWKGYGTPKSSYKQSSGSKGSAGGWGSYIHKAEGAAKVDKSTESSSSSTTSTFGASIPSAALVAIGVAVLGTVLLAGVVAYVIRSVRRRRQLQAEVASAMNDAAAA